MGGLLVVSSKMKSERSWCSRGSSAYFAVGVLVVSLRPTLPPAYFRYPHIMLRRPLGQQHHLCCAIRRSVTYQGGPLKANSRQKKIGASVAVEMKCYYGGSV
jgi:hypothetical protein